MFDAVRNNKKISQLFLALITVPFALWGVESYIADRSANAELAKVGDTVITHQEFQNAMREQEDRLRQQMGAQFDPKMLQSKAARESVLDMLVNQRVLALVTRDSHLGISDAALAKFIAGVPALQEDGKFSPERYAAVVAGRGMSKEAFEARLRQDMAQQQIVQVVGDAAFSSKEHASRWALTQLETRMIEEFRLGPESFAKEIKIEDADVANYYESNKSRFELPEQVRVEYLVLDQNELQSQIKVSDAEIETRYKAKQANYAQAEQRRASHILIKVGKDAPEAEAKAAQAKMAEAQAKLAKDPKAFAELAKKYSDDPGSAEKGGDLEWFGRGMMVKPFEDAVFSLKEGETSDVVRSDFGLHLIRVTGIKAAQVQPLAAVRSTIEAELAREAAVKKFAELAESFGNTVYEQPDSLKPAAENYKLALRQSDWLRKGTPLPPPFDNAKLSAAIFTADATSKMHNTEAIEVGPGRLVAARVFEHKPAAVQALDQVKPAIIARLTQERAGERASTEGKSKLAALQKGESLGLKFGPARPLLRAAPAGLSREAAREVFAVDVAKLPTYVGAVQPDGAYSIYKVTTSVAAAAEDPRKAMLAQQYQRAVAEAEFSAWIHNLRQRYKIAVNPKAMADAES
jgi:peptidyl-prolyl cis-trans isomerase D